MAKTDDLQPFSPYLGAGCGPGQGYDPDDSWMPYSPEEHRASLFARPARAIIGGHVMYRHDLHGDVTDAVVLGIEYDSPEQTYIDGLLVKLPPWPTLLLDTLYGRVRTREARTRGSAGWLPAGWHSETFGKAS